MDWAWQYEANPDGGRWIQFDCSECLVLEYAYQAYQVTLQESLRMIEIMSGTVDLENYTLTLRINPD